MSRLILQVYQRKSRRKDRAGRGPSCATNPGNVARVPRACRGVPAAVLPQLGQVELGLDFLAVGRLDDDTRRARGHLLRVVGQVNVGAGQQGAPPTREKWCPPTAPAFPSPRLFEAELKLAPEVRVAQVDGPNVNGPRVGRV